MATKLMSTRIDEHLLAEVDDVARLESELIGLPIDRTAYVQRALREDVSRRRKTLQARPPAGAAK